jgi:iron-sulfur cluster insertion protein
VDHETSIDFFGVNYNICDMSESFITVTPRAAQRIHEIAAKQGTHAALRIAVNGGGCSGFQYDFALDDKREEDDRIFEVDGAQVLVDVGQSFRIQNPLAKSSCGCGTSFSL